MTKIVVFIFDIRYPNVFFVFTDAGDRFERHSNDETEFGQSSVGFERDAGHRFNRNGADTAAESAFDRKTADLRKIVDENNYSESNDDDDDDADRNERTIRSACSFARIERVVGAGMSFFLFNAKRKKNEKI